LDNDDIVKTVFKNHFGLFEYTMVPFGLPHTPSVFMAVMNDVLQGISFVSVYLNDILIIFIARRTHQTCYHSIVQKNVMKSFEALRSALVDAPAIINRTSICSLRLNTDASDVAFSVNSINKLSKLLMKQRS
jgi:hypothetical protein